MHPNRITWLDHSIMWLSPSFLLSCWREERVVLSGTKSLFKAGGTWRDPYLAEASFGSGRVGRQGGVEYAYISILYAYLSGFFFPYVNYEARGVCVCGPRHKKIIINVYMDLALDAGGITGTYVYSYCRWGRMEWEEVGEVGNKRWNTFRETVGIYTYIIYWWHITSGICESTDGRR